MILFFIDFSAQRRELRKIWNGSGKCWDTFLKDSDKKAVEVADSLKISLLELSRTYHINEIFSTYNDLYKN
jgi:hypothetical protein